MPFLDNQLKSPNPLLLPAVDAVTPLSESEVVGLAKTAFASATERDIYTAAHLKSHSHMVLRCSLLCSSTPVQAMTLIGKQGSLIKSIQESSGASVRVLPGDETLSSAAPNEKIVELHGEALKVAKALEAVIGQLRKFLVDQTVLPLFEKTLSNSTVSQERHVEAWHDNPSILPASQIGSGG